jgi:DNA-directed RNA polymerase specialized sigma24 family protein
LCIKRDEIIEHLTTESWFKEACYKIAPNKDVGDELYQYAFLKLLEKPSKQIEEIYEGGYIRFYVVRLLYNAIHGKCSPFDKNRLWNYEEVCDIQEDEDHSEIILLREKKYNSIEKVVAQLYWYDREIFTMWQNGNSARAIHRQTKISINEVLRVIKKVKQLINDEYNS